MVIRGTAGIAFYAAQHNNSLEAGFAHTPGLLVVMPSTPADTKGLIKSALRCGDPVVFLMHKSLTGLRGEVPEGEHLVPLGEAAIRRAGDDGDGRRLLGRSSAEPREWPSGWPRRGSPSR